MELLTRRQFLALAGIGLSAAAQRFTPAKLPRSSAIVSQHCILMGTLVNVTVVSNDRRAARDAIYAGLAEMAKLEAVLSRFNPASEVATLNAEGSVEGPHAALLAVLNQAQTVSELSHGAFDCTVKPLLDLYDYHASHFSTVPQPEALEDALALVDYRDLLLSESRIAFARAGMGATLDGIAKGYIVDAGMAAMRAHGFNDVLIEAGGDLATSGVRDQDEPWRIGIQSPRPGPKRIFETISLPGRAVATSGDYLQAYTPDFRNHHIVDPRSGHSSAELASATVIASSALLADSLATALMVLGPEQGRLLMASLPGAEARLVTKTMDVVRL